MSTPITVHLYYESLCFEVKEKSVGVIAAKKESEVDSCIEQFLSNCGNRSRVFGLHTEWSVVADPNSKSKAKSQVAILQLCDAHSCLIVQLAYFDSIPKSLLNFLLVPRYTFVGIGIKDEIAKLGKVYGLGCKNAVELGPLAASVLEKPSLSACGLHLLSVAVLGSARYSVPIVVSCDWGGDTLSMDQITYSTSNAYACYRIGKKLLRSYS